MAWTPLPLPIDEAQIIRTILTGIAERITGWAPSEGSVEVALAEEIGVQLAAVNLAAVEATNHAAAGVATALGFEPIAGTRAVLPGVELTAQLPPSTASAPFSRAVTVPAGFTIAVGDRAFIVPKQVTLVADFTAATAPGFEGYWRGVIEADFLASDVGDAWNLGEAGEPASIQTVSPILIAATLTGPSAGGEGAETLDAFLARFVAWMGTLKPGGVRAEDLATFASTVSGTARALALDRYDPADPATPADRTVTIIPVAPTGEDLATFEKARLQEALERIREVGFVFHIIDPTRTPVDVAVTVTPGSTFEAGAVEQDVHAALTAALSPAAWGTTDGDPATWTERDTLRVLDIAVVTATVPGVAAIGDITINGGDDDVALAGPGALLEATVTVTAS